jgi:hypothetical protein
MTIIEVVNINKIFKMNAPFGSLKMRWIPKNIRISSIGIKAGNIFRLGIR